MHFTHLFCTSLPYKSHIYGHHIVLQILCKYKYLVADCKRGDMTHQGVWQRSADTTPCLDWSHWTGKCNKSALSHIRADRQSHSCCHITGYPLTAAHSFTQTHDCRHQPHSRQHTGSVWSTKVPHRPLGMSTKKHVFMGLMQMSRAL